MGTWNIKIDRNDTFRDIYQNFFDLYNEGHSPMQISKQIWQDFADMFADSDDQNNCFFALALAQWETKSLEPAVFKKVQGIIESGGDLKVWKELGADEETLELRKNELKKFLKKISVEKVRSKRRVTKKVEYKIVNLFRLPSPNGIRVFNIVETYINGEYRSTNARMDWQTGGGGIFQFVDQGKFVAAKWIDDHKLEISHDKTINFYQQAEIFFFCGDEGTITYRGK